MAARGDVSQALQDTSRHCPNVLAARNIGRQTPRQLKQKKGGGNTVRSPWETDVRCTWGGEGMGMGALRAPVEGVEGVDDQRGTGSRGI